MFGGMLAYYTLKGGSKMRSRKFYETYWKHYDDMVNFENFREMLGGIGDVQARRLLQKKIVKSFKIRGEYRIPKACVIDYVLSPIMLNTGKA